MRFPPGNEAEALCVSGIMYQHDTGNGNKQSA
jgi:hypothetical protein